MCRSMADIRSTAAEIRRGKKKKKKERNYRMKILWSALLHRATKISGYKPVTYTTVSNHFLGHPVVWELGVCGKPLDGSVPITELNHP